VSSESPSFESASNPSRSITTRSSASVLPTQNDTAKNLFKKLTRRYMRTQTPPSDRDLEPLINLRQYYTYDDVIAWRDSIGLRRGVVYEADGTVSFEECPVPPHERIIGEFTNMFMFQMINSWYNTPNGPMFYTTGSEGKFQPQPPNSSFCLKA
jgi:hypothetical protein